MGHPTVVGLEHFGGKGVIARHSQEDPLRSTREEFFPGGTEMPHFLKMLEEKYISA